jgi:hypothetical protein
MCAFSFEAYINFLGDKLIENWDGWQRFDNKLKQVLKRLGVTPDQNKRPYSAIKRLKAFRDSMAHGKPDEEEYDEIVEIAGDGSDARPDLGGTWVANLRHELSFEIYEDIDAIWKEFIAKSGLSVL